MGTPRHPPSLSIASFDIHTLPAGICSQHILHSSGLTTAVKGLVTNYGDGGGRYKTGGGGAHEVLPLRKGGGGVRKKF